jgi:hypothetical protein
MSRKIDLDSDLSADDALYLQDRPDLINEAKLQGASDIEERIASALEPDPVPEVQTSDDDVATFTNYEGLGLADLRKLAASRGLSDSGAKKVITDRLRAADVSTGVTATVSREAEGAVGATAPPEAPEDSAGTTPVDQDGSA